MIDIRSDACFEAVRNAIKEHRERCKDPFVCCDGHIAKAVLSALLGQLQMSEKDLLSLARKNAQNNKAHYATISWEHGYVSAFEDLGLVRDNENKDE